MSIRNFISNLKYNPLSKPFLFEVDLVGLVADRNASLLCHQATIPGFNFQMQPNQIYGVPYHSVTGIQYSPATFSCYVDSSLGMLAELHSIKDSCINQTNFSPAYYDSYVGEAIEIRMFDVDNVTEVGWFTLKNVVLTGVDSSPLDWAAQNNVLNLIFTVQYEYYISNFNNTSGSSGSNQYTLMDAYSSGASNMAMPVNFDTIQQINPSIAANYRISATNQYKQLTNSININSPLSNLNQLSDVPSNITKLF